MSTEEFPDLSNLYRAVRNADEELVKARNNFVEHLRQLGINDPAILEGMIATYAKDKEIVSEINKLLINVYLNYVRSIDPKSIQDFQLLVKAYEFLAKSRRSCIDIVPELPNIRVKIKAVGTNLALTNTAPEELSKVISDTKKYNYLFDEILKTCLENLQRVDKNILFGLFQHKEFRHQIKSDPITMANLVNKASNDVGNSTSVNEAKQIIAGYRKLKSAKLDREIMNEYFRV